MATKLPDIDGTKEAATDNLAPGVAGGVGVLLGRSILGPAIGPMLGGAVAGATQSNQTRRDVITINGIMMGMGNLMGSGGSRRTSSGGRGRL